MNAWRCDRCGLVSGDGNVDDPPPDWRYTAMPVRGSQGARSTSDAVICDVCDDELYEWYMLKPVR